MHTEKRRATAVKMYPFIQEQPLSDIHSRGVMRHAMWGYVVFAFIVSCVADKKKLG